MPIQISSRHPPLRLLPWLLAGCLCASPGAPLGATASVDATSPPPLLLANRIGPQIDVRRYLASEKLDGVRAHWDGSRLRFRSGRVIAAPRWFLDRLPATALDGELWLGRGRFDALSAIVRSETADDAAWAAVRYMVFELPGAGGSFAERAQRIDEIVGRIGWHQLQAVRQWPVASSTELQRRFDAIVGSGGEGVMLHLASARYSTGRSDELIKLKPQLDTEAVVVGYRPGRGRLAGTVGALHLQMPDGRRFWLGSGLTDIQRRDPPALGSIVTYRYRELTPSGLPRFASFVRVRDGF